VRKMRNITILCTIFILSLSLYCPVVLGAIDDYQITVAGASGVREEADIEVPISINRVIGQDFISSCDIWLDYDAASLEPTEVLNGDLTQTWTLWPNLTVSGQVRISLSSPYDLPDDPDGGNLAIIKFTVKDNASIGTTDLTLRPGEIKLGGTVVPSGNLNNGEFEVIDDTPLPVVTIDSPQDDDMFNPYSTLTVAGTVTGDGVTEVTISGGDPSQLPVDVVLEPDNSFTHDFGAALTYLVEGSNVITVEATDTGGGTSSESVNVVYDSIEPAITITSPTTEPIPTATLPITITVEGSILEEGTGIEWVKVDGNDATLTGANYTYDLEIDSFGDHTITVTCQDLAENIGTNSVDISVEDVFVAPDVIHVKTTGIDDVSLADGSEEQPFRTIGFAVNYLGPGKKLIVHAETYNEGVVIGDDIDGEIDDRITIEAEGVVTIDGAGFDNCMLVGGDYIDITGFTFINADEDGLKIDGGDNVTVTKCLAYDNTRDGFRVLNSSDINFNSCVSYNNDSSGIYLGNITGLLIQNSVSFGNTGGCGIKIDHVDEFILRHNIAFNNDIGFYMEETRGTPNTIGTFYNNVAYSNTSNGFEMEASDVGVILVNNISDANGVDIALGITPSRVENNYWTDGVYYVGDDSGSPDISGSHGFVNPGDPDDVILDTTLDNFAACSGFALDPDISICIDAGENLAYIDSFDAPDKIKINDGLAVVKPLLYFRIGDELCLQSAALPHTPILGTNAKINDINQNDAIVLDVSVDAIGVGASIDLVKVTDGMPDIGVYELSSHSWPFDPSRYGDYMHFFPIHGTVRVNGESLDTNAWIGVFDEAGNCYGIGEYKDNIYQGTYTYALSAYPDVPNHGIDGFQDGDLLKFKLFIPGQESVEVISYNPDPSVDPPYGPLPYHYPYNAVMNDTIDPVEIHLTTVDTKDINLVEGWNFISFNIRPSSDVLEEAFRSILDDLLHVYNLQGDYWDRTIWLDPEVPGGGALNTINAEESYYVNVSENCTLSITGIYMPLPYEFTLDSGWNSISYLYLTERDVFGNAANPGMLSTIASDVIWAKVRGLSRDFAVQSPREDARLENGSGIFIKMGPLPTPITLRFEKE